MISRRAYFFLQEAIIWSGGITVAGSIYYIFFVRPRLEQSIRDSSAAKRLSVAALIAEEQQQQQQPVAAALR